MEIKCFTVGMFSVNTYLITDPETQASAIIDTGESDELVKRIKALDPPPDIQKILLTHAHIDHAGALSLLQEEWDVPTYMPKKEWPLFKTLPMQGTMFGMPHLNRPCGRIDHEVAHLTESSHIQHANITAVAILSQTRSLDSEANGFAVELCCTRVDHKPSAGQPRPSAACTVGPK